MGYNPGVKVYKLVFVDREGLIVKVVSLPLGEYMVVERLATLADTLSGEAATDNLRELFRLFAKYLTYWNIELPEDPTDPESPAVPVPTTYEGVMRLDEGLVTEIITAWIEAMAGTSPPLDQPSISGETVLEGSIPMETLSTSLLS
jgi:hypothetical protein